MELQVNLITNTVQAIFGPNGNVKRSIMSVALHACIVNLCIQKNKISQGTAPNI